jgi:hypothetical protein
MNKSISILALGAAFAFSGSALADMPHKFAPGQKALASEVNANFTHLDSRIDALEGLASDANANLNHLDSRIGALEGAAAGVETLTVAGNLFVMDQATVVQTFQATVALSQGGTPGYCNRLVRTWNKQDATTWIREDRYFDADNSPAIPGAGYDSGTCPNPQNQTWKYDPTTGAFGIAAIDVLQPDGATSFGTIIYTPMMGIYWDNSRLGSRMVAGVTENNPFTAPTTTAYLHQSELIPTTYIAQGGTGPTYHDCYVLAFGKFAGALPENFIACRINPGDSHYSMMTTLTSGRYWVRAAN